MANTALIYNAKAITNDLKWLGQVIDVRFRLYFEHECDFATVRDVPMPLFNAGTCPYTAFIQEHELGFAERIYLLMALAPYIQPQLLDMFFVKNKAYDRAFSEFGGVRNNQTNGFIPTAETVLFVLAGDNLQERFEHYYIFEKEHVFTIENALYLEHAKGSGFGFFDAPIGVSGEFLNKITTGKTTLPDFSAEFPAHRITTGLTWKDVVLDRKTLNQLDEIKAWVQYGKTMLEEWGMARKMSPGYHSLFYGPPGTGKTLTATLLGNATDRHVYRIDLSAVVSKYIGETEKNLSRVFDRAENKDWILFFDEADALFGKRTEVSDAHDRYANQEVSYLLQRMEKFSGVVILASNKKGNIDEAFSRRFQTIIHFPIPKPEQRLLIWERAFSEKAKLEKQVNLKKIATEYDMSGGSIMNVVRFSSLMALKNNTTTIALKDLHTGIKREYQKEGRSL